MYQSLLWRCMIRDGIFKVMIFIWVVTRILIDGKIWFRILTFFVFGTIKLTNLIIWNVARLSVGTYILYVLVYSVAYIDIDDNIILWTHFQAKAYTFPWFWIVFQSDAHVFIVIQYSPVGIIIDCVISYLPTWKSFKRLRLL